MTLVGENRAYVLLKRLHRVSSSGGGDDLSSVLPDVIEVAGEHGSIQLAFAKRRIRDHGSAQCRNRHEYFEIQRSLDDERPVEVENRDPPCRRNVGLVGRVGNGVDKREDPLLDRPVRPRSEPGNGTRRLRCAAARPDKRCHQY